MRGDYVVVVLQSVSGDTQMFHAAERSFAELAEPLFLSNPVVPSFFFGTDLTDNARNTVSIDPFGSIYLSLPPPTPPITPNPTE